MKEAVKNLKTSIINKDFNLCIKQYNHIVWSIGEIRNGSKIVKIKKGSY